MGETSLPSIVIDSPRVAYIWVVAMQIIWGVKAFMYTERFKDLPLFVIMQQHGLSDLLMN